MSGKAEHKRLLFVNNNMEVGGVQKSLANLLACIHNDYEIDVLLFCKKGSLLDDIPDDVHILECESLFRYFGFSQGEAMSMKEGIVRGALAMMCRLFGREKLYKLFLKSQRVLPVEYDCSISYLHDGRPSSLYGGVNEFVLRCTRASRKVAFLHCDYKRAGGNYPENNRRYGEFNAIAACSRGCRDSFVEVVPSLENRCQVVPNCHNYDAIKRLSMANPFSYREDSFNILYIGRLAHEKGVERAIAAISFVKSKGINATLHLVGDGGMRVKLEELALKVGLQDQVVFHGEQSNPYRFMSNADCLIITSYHEAAPLVIDEASFVGLPVLTVATTSSNEMVAKRHCGWVCENSQEGINDMLLSLLQQPEIIAETKKCISQLAFNNIEAVSAFATLVDE